LDRRLYADAEVNFRNVLRNFPTAYHARLQLGWALENQNVTDGALREYYAAAQWYRQQTPTRGLNWLNERIVGLGGQPVPAHHPRNNCVAWFFAGARVAVGLFEMSASASTASKPTRTPPPTGNYTYIPQPTPVAARDGKTLQQQPQDVKDQF